LRRRALTAVLVPIAAVLAGCGSSSSTLPNAPAAAQASSTNAAAPKTSAPPSFVVSAGTHGGDAVKIEGWFGPPLPAGESNIEHTALGQCASPTDDGRAIVVALDLKTTLESSLAGEVELNLGTFPTETLGEYVLGFSTGAECTNAEINPTGIKLGNLRPHQSATFSMWIAFINAITSDDPHPSESTLRSNSWLMSLPFVTVDGESGRPLPNEQPSATGSRVVQCIQTSYSSGERAVAVIGGTPKVVHAKSCP
jgi:hypothetical protein